MSCPPPHSVTKQNYITYAETDRAGLREKNMCLMPPDEFKAACSSILVDATYS